MPQTHHLFERPVHYPAKLTYWLHLPAAYEANPARRWPLILFLHGKGERGSDPELLKIHGVIKVAEASAAAGEDFPFIVLAPQCPLDSWWPREVYAVAALLDDIMARLRVDQDRIYLTGLSMGGFGTWELALRFPQRFAAIAPICGGGEMYIDWPQRIQEIAHIPAWVFHGAKDKIVPVSRSRQMVRLLKKAGADVQLTIYPEAEHDSWTETYNNPALYDWFLTHTRRKS